MLHIPKDLKRKNPWMIIVVMGIAVISFLLAANVMMTVALVMAQPSGVING